jgi:chromosome segregation ATPase
MEYPTAIDSTKYTETATAIRKSQPVFDNTCADDLAIDLRNRQEREKFHAGKVEELAKQVGDLTAKWQKLNDAIASATKLLETRPWLRQDIAAWKKAMESIEQDGEAIKKVLQAQEVLLKQSKKDLQQLSEKNPRGFDFKTFERLKAEDAALEIR